MKRSRQNKITDQIERMAYIRSCDHSMLKSIERHAKRISRHKTINNEILISRSIMALMSQKG